MGVLLAVMSAPGGQKNEPPITALRIIHNRETIYIDSNKEKKPPDCRGTYNRFKIRLRRNDRAY